MAMNLGKRIAPPRFLMFLAVLAIGRAVAIPRLGWGRGALVAFDVASAVFLIAMLRLFVRKHTVDAMRAAANANDANRAMLLAITAVTTLIVLVAVGKELQSKGNVTAFALVMTFQTSDVEIPSRRIRFGSLGQCLAAFVFNLGVLAFTINTIGGG